MTCVSMGSDVVVGLRVFKSMEVSYLIIILNDEQFVLVNVKIIIYFILLLAIHFVLRVKLIAIFLSS